MERRTVMITGGSRGIGRAISLRFAKAEAKVFINFFQNRTAAEKTAQDVESLGARVYLHQADLKDEEQIRQMFNEVQRQFGGLDVLVHSAASGVLRSVTELSGKHWDWVMNTNAQCMKVEGLSPFQASVPVESFPSTVLLEFPRLRWKA